MPLNLPFGADCFVDTNIFVYHFTSQDAEGAACSDFLIRVARGDLRASVSMPVLADVVHKVMLAEVRSRYALDRAGLVSWLQRHRYRLSELTETLAACDQTGTPAAGSAAAGVRALATLGRARPVDQ
jgi:predicted nucleic acid-binding protein